MLTPKQSKLFGESCYSSIVSINSTALKYLTIPDLETKDLPATEQIIRNVFHTIVTFNGLVNHPFLPYIARVYTLASYAVENRENFLREAKTLLLKDH